MMRHMKPRRARLCGPVPAARARTTGHLSARTRAGAIVVAGGARRCGDVQVGTAASLGLSPDSSPSADAWRARAPTPPEPPPPCSRPPTPHTDPMVTPCRAPCGPHAYPISVGYRRELGAHRGMRPEGPPRARRKRRSTPLDARATPSRPCPMGALGAGGAGGPSIRSRAPSAAPSGGFPGRAGGR